MSYQSIDEAWNLKVSKDSFDSRACSCWYGRKHWNNDSNSSKAILFRNQVIFFEISQFQGEKISTRDEVNKAVIRGFAQNG